IALIHILSCSILTFDVGTSRGGQHSSRSCLLQFFSLKSDLVGVDFEVGPLRIKPYKVIQMEEEDLKLLDGDVYSEMIDGSPSIKFL
ncbi:hypothetical protein Gorai_020964, partial [Gossypium raimondii]|nr:hypothetical protein [Gossypium raimondii]